MQYLYQLRKHHHIVAGVVLAAMLALSITSLRGDAPTFDETAHIAAGYSYLKLGDDRLNPEHPPLIKDLAGLPLLALQPRFSLQQPHWSDDPDAQWQGGRDFLFGRDNPTEQMVMLARLPILLLGLALGLAIYRFSLKHYDPATALLALVLFAFLPETLAHARYVTTDMGVTLFIFLSLISFAAWLKRPAQRRLVLAALALAAANLSKFSALLLYPTLAAVTVARSIIAGRHDKAQRSVLGLAAMTALSGLLIWGVYAWQSRNLPVSVNDGLIAHTAAAQPSAFLHYINHQPVLKPLVQYGLGLAMVSNRFDGSDSRITYLLGHAFVGHSPWYFPVLFVCKTPLPLLVLVACTMVWWLRQRRSWRPGLTHLVRQRPAEACFIVFIIAYSGLAIAGNYNFGLRHLLPIMPPLIILVARQTVLIVRELRPRRWPAAVLGALLVWYVAGTLLVYPSFLAYFNELAGGANEADKIAAHSNVDWGQDIGRLAAYLKAHPEIDQLAVDYFGTAAGEYYFCRPLPQPDGSRRYDCHGSRYLPWNTSKGRYPGRYIGVSETILAYDRYNANAGQASGYAYLRARQPIAKIGYSIYIYQLR